MAEAKVRRLSHLKTSLNAPSRRKTADDKGASRTPERYKTPTKHVPSHTGERDKVPFEVRSGSTLPFFFSFVLHKPSGKAFSRQQAHTCPSLPIASHCTHSAMAHTRCSLPLLILSLTSNYSFFFFRLPVFFILQFFVLE